MPGPILLKGVVILYKLQKLNVEKIVADENSRDKLIAQGFKLVKDNKANKKVLEEDNKLENDNSGNGAENGKKNYADMDLEELKAIAKEKGVANYWNRSKETLVEELTALEGK